MTEFDNVRGQALLQPDANLKFGERNEMILIHAAEGLSLFLLVVNVLKWSDSIPLKLTGEIGRAHASVECLKLIRSELCRSDIPEELNRQAAERSAKMYTYGQWTKFCFAL